MNQDKSNCEHALRGGSWSSSRVSSMKAFRSVFRTKSEPVRLSNTGFRVARGTKHVQR